MPRVTDQATAAPPLTRLWEVPTKEAAVSIGWSASGKWLAAATAEGEVYLIETTPAEDAQHWQAHRMGATAIAWHPTEELFASAGQDGTAKLWRPGHTDPVATLDCGTAWTEHLAWSPSGEFLATACGRQLKLWNIAGAPVLTLQEQPNTIAGLQWEANSRGLVSACYGQVVFWSTGSTEPKKTWYWKGSMVSLALSPDGKYLCHGNQDATVHFWIVAKAAELQMSGYPLKVSQLSWDRRGRYLATSGSPQITVWDCSGKGPRGSKPETLFHHLMPLRALRYQADGPMLASGCASGVVAVWRPSKRNRPEASANLSSPITDVAWCANTQKLAAATESGTIVVFDATTAA